MAPAPSPTSETVARRFRRQPRRDTAPDLAVRCRLHARGVGYRWKDPVLPTPRRLGAVPGTGPRDPARWPRPARQSGLVGREARGQRRPRPTGRRGAADPGLAATPLLGAPGPRCG